MLRSYCIRQSCGRGHGASGVVPNSAPCQIMHPLVLVGLGVGVGEGLGLGVGLRLGNQVAISTRGCIIWQGCRIRHNTCNSTFGLGSR